MITKPDNMQQALWQTEEHYRLLAENSTDTIWTVDLSGRLTYISPSVELLTGFSPEEAMQRSIVNAMTPASVKLVQEDMKRIIDKAAIGERLEPKLLILEYLRKDGSTVWAETTSRGMFDAAGRLFGIQRSTRDITERRQMEHDLLRERNHLQTLLDFYRRADTRIKDIEAFVIEECIRISESSLGFFGFVNEDETEMRTHVWSEQAMAACGIDFKPVVFSLDHAGIWSEAIKTREVLVVNDYLAPDPRKKGYPDGHVSLQRVLSIPIVKGTKTVAVMAVANKKQDYTQADILHLSLFIESMWDVLKRNEAEEKLRNLNERLEQNVEERTRQLMEAQEELVRKEKLAILGQLSGSVGHELRNPLGVMNNAVYYLQAVLPDTDDTVKEYLGIIKHEIDNSLRIITDLLDFARTKPPQTQTVAASGFIDKNLEKHRIPENITVRKLIPENLPSLRIDPQQMDQVLQNLITNAIQAMPDGGELRIAMSPVKGSECKADGCEDKKTEHGTLKIEPQIGFIEISVTDTGVGISEENMKKLFQPLFTTKARGIGLGLVVCKNLTEANGGRIEVESETGKGTTFRVILPTTQEKGLPDKFA